MWHNINIIYIYYSSSATGRGGDGWAQGAKYHVPTARQQDLISVFNIMLYIYIYILVYMP